MYRSKGLQSQVNVTWRASLQVSTGPVPHRSVCSPRTPCFARGEDAKILPEPDAPLPLNEQLTFWPGGGRPCCAREREGGRERRLLVQRGAGVFQTKDQLKARTSGALQSTLENRT